MPRPGRTALVVVAAALLGGALAVGVRALREPSDDPADAPVARPAIFFDDFSDPRLAARGWTTTPQGGTAVVRGLLDLRRAVACHTPRYGAGTSAARIRLGAGATAAFTVPGSFAFQLRTGTLLVAPPAGAPRRIGRRGAGWHVLVAQIEGNAIAYYVDDELVAAPRGRMDGTAAALTVAGETPIAVDWVFHQAGALLTPAEVTGAVASLRTIGVGHQDTLPSASPSRCV